MTILAMNGTEIDSVNFNGTDCDNVYFNGVKVWTRGAVLVAGAFTGVFIIPITQPPEQIPVTYTGFSIAYPAFPPYPSLQAIGSLTPSLISNLVATGSPPTATYTLATERFQSGSTLSYMLSATGWASAETVTLNPVSITGVFAVGGSRTIVLNFGSRTTDLSGVATWRLGGMSSDDEMVTGNSYIVSAG